MAGTFELEGKKVACPVCGHGNRITHLGLDGEPLRKQPFAAGTAKDPAPTFCWGCLHLLVVVEGQVYQMSFAQEMALDSRMRRFIYDAKAYVRGSEIHQRCCRAPCRCDPNWKGPIYA